MTLSLERARTRRPVTWLTLLGVVLLPVLVGGILVVALDNPVERLDGIRAAIVNDDDPVTIDGQYVPLGRQLTAGLIEGSDDEPSNLTWTISNETDAAEGLADGTYDAVVTIPAEFSAAATSTAPGGTPQRATISVQTPPDSRIVDDAITAQVTQTAASLMGEQLSATYLENVYLGFTTLGDSLGEAAEGADDLAGGATSLSDGVAQLAEGASGAADGAAELPGGAGQLATGAQGLGDGAGQLATGLDALGAGTRTAASGAGQLVTGAQGLGDGAAQLATGLDALAAGTRTAQDGATRLADQTRAGAAQLVADGIVPQALLDYAANAATGSANTAGAIGAVAVDLGALASDCVASGATAEFCARLGAAAASTGTAAQTAAGAATDAGYASGGLQQFAVEAPAGFAAQLNAIADGAAQLADGMTPLAAGIDQSAAGARSLADGAGQLADGAGQLATGMTPLAAGIDQSAAGARSLSSGAGQLADGAGQLASGSQTLADGLGTLATGTAELGTGASRLADGTHSLADGLSTAAGSVPSYTESEADRLAEVVARPVTTEGVGSDFFGASAIPLLATLALWFGGLATFVALRAVPRGVLSSRRPSIVLALRALAPAAGIGALQGLLVACVVQLAAAYDGATWVAFAGVTTVTGVVFAIVHQGFVAVFEGAGRWVAALVGVLAVATGVVSTVPGFIVGVADLMPTAPAYRAMLTALTPAGGAGAALAGLLAWSIVAFAATVVVVARRRSTSVRAVLTASAA
ncbi:YhgE/Pip family protein [Microbacterium sp.]|uniref:YhgE/Pip domain-containing protein n=1 Tax=Microbacterium sp. TaxID=51671 RepID=UPI0039E69DCD